LRKSAEGLDCRSGSEQGRVKGLELARRYFEDIALPAFERKAPEALQSMAFGLAGPGSECYGFDDRISRDHDWGPRVCIWIPEPLYQEQGERLQRIYDQLDKVFLGFGPVHRLDTRVRRDGVLSIERFYRTYLGTGSPPETIRDWLLLPEEALSLCTNGEVFLDPLGSFTRMRRALLAYFPRDLWLKKIASRCRAIGEHGQYNLWRAHERGDRIAFHYHKACFARESAALTFLLAKTYRPFAKWLFHGLRNLGRLGSVIHEHLLAVAGSEGEPTLQGQIEACLGVLIDELVDQQLAERAGPYLLDYGLQIQRTIRDPSLREQLDSVD
jgi:hypothetical protein